MVFVSLLQFVFDNLTSALVLTSICILFADYWKKRWNNQPPGPFNVPFLGCVSFFSCKRPEQFLAGLRHKYGNVLGFYLGEKYILVLNDLVSIKENLNREELLGRPQIHPLTLIGKNSIITASGSTWKQEKQISQKILHELGVGRKIMEERIKDEIFHFMMVLEEHKECSFEMRKHLQVTMNNNISSLIFGHRFDYDDPVAAYLIKNIQELEESTTNVDITSFFPYLAPIAKMLGVDQDSKCQSSMDAVGKIIRKEIDKEKTFLGQEEISSYLQGYLLQREKDKENATLTEERLLGTAKANYLGGVTTTVTSIEWLLLALIANPDVQERVQREIDITLLKKGTIDWSDRKYMPYTEAVILETMRWRTLAPLSAPRCILKDTTINGYRVPRNTIVFPNLWAAHNDASIWEHPEKFNPNRFLNEEGNIVKSDWCIPFSFGRRSCPGESLGRLQTFLYAVEILGKYSVSLANGETLDLEPTPTFLCAPKDFKLFLTPRTRS